MRMRRVLLNVAIAATILLAAEGWCSLGDRLPKYRISAALGYELAPGYVGRHETVSLAGLRGAEPRPRAPGRLRILAMGGSTTWGHKVDDDETWPVALERELVLLTGRDVEVLNGGVSGWGFEHIVTALRNGFLDTFRPDVVLVFEGWNYPLIQANQVTLMRAPIIAANRRDGLHRSALVRAVERMITEWREERDQNSPDPRPSPALQAVRAEHYPRLFAEMARLCHEHGARLALLRYPALVQRAPPADPSARAAYEADLRDNLGSERDFDALVDCARQEYDAGLSAVLAAAGPAGIEVLDVAQRMEAELPADGADRTWAGYFRDHFHFTGAGDAALGRALAELLQEKQLVPPR